MFRKFSTDNEYNEEEVFKNKTLRFTNNNFVSSNKQDTTTTNAIGKRTAVDGFSNYGL